MISDGVPFISDAVPYISDRVPYNNQWRSSLDQPCKVHPVYKTAIPQRADSDYLKTCLKIAWIVLHAQRMKKFLSLFYWRSWTKELKQLPIIIHHKLKYILKGNSSGQAQIDGRHSYKRHVHRINLTICRFIWNCVIWICDIWVSFPSFSSFSIHN